MKLKENIAGFGVLGILTVLVLLPLAAVLAQVVCPGLSLDKFDAGNLRLVLDVFVRPLWKKAFFNSAGLSLATTVFGLLLAGALAHVRVRYEFPLARLLDSYDYALLYSGPGVGLFCLRKRHRQLLAAHSGDELFSVQLPRPGLCDGAV